MLYRNPEQIQVFSPEWFKYQEPALLKLVNDSDPYVNQFWRYCMGIPSDYDQAIIAKVRHDCFHLYDGANKRVGVFYSGNPIAKTFRSRLIPLWFSAHVYDSIMKKLRINSNLGFDTMTQSPQAGYDGSTCDGYLYINGSDYNTIYDSGAWLGGSIGSSLPTMQMIYEGAYYIYRSVVMFNTSSLTNSATITADSTNPIISFYINLVLNDNTDTFNVVSFTPSAYNTLTAYLDYVSFGSTSYCGKALADVVTDQYDDLVLNSTGAATINKTGVTAFGGRLSQDLSKTTPTGANRYNAYQSDGGTSTAPKLTIVYTLPATGRKVNVYSN